MHNKITIVNGETFHSQGEYYRYRELQLLEKAGQIKNLRRQVKYELIPKQIGERATSYYADFVYEENGKEIVEDFKGMKTKEYIIKRKLMLYIHGIKIKET